MDKKLHQRRKNELRKRIDNEQFDLVLIVLIYLFPPVGDDDWQVDGKLLDEELIKLLRRLCAIKAHIENRKLLDILAKICGHPKVKLTFECEPAKDVEERIKPDDPSSKRKTIKPK